MKDSKAIYVTKRDLRDNPERIDSNRTLNDKEITSYYDKSRDMACQFDGKRDNVICTCKNVLTIKKKDNKYFSGPPKQVYTYHGSRSYTDVGVGSVKALQRKKVKRIHLPETDDRGVGSEDLTSFISRRTRYIKGSNHYDHKRTSSKCVGAIIEYNTGCVMSEKLSPIIQTRSRTTSPMEPLTNNKNTEIGSNTVGKVLITANTQVETEFIGPTLEVQLNTIDKDLVSNVKEDVCKATKKKEIMIERAKFADKKVKLVERAVSSDSLVQHVHNLENPSDEIQSHMSVDPMENKIEREYRQMFATKDEDIKPSIEKTLPDLKSTSLLKRRFEALRRGLLKKQESKKKSVIVKTSSQMSVHSRRDVSIASDPPSLEARSYSNTKTYSPFEFNREPDMAIYKPGVPQRKSFSRRKDKESSQWSQLEEESSDYQGVKGMFKLWGKKFNLEEEYYKKRTSPNPPFSEIKPLQPLPGSDVAKFKTEVKKDSKKFFFFKKKNKEKNKEPYKPKKGVTAGRCEIRDGLTIRIGANAITTEEKEKIYKSQDILQTLWFQKYLSYTTESRDSVQVRWNNKTYATSSSTIFELMDTVYKETGIVFRSRSEISTAESSYYKSYTQHVNFAQQEIEAWMIPKTITDRPKQLPVRIKNRPKDSVGVRISDQKCFIDKSKAFSHKIEVVLHSRNMVKPNKEGSSEYLRIDIPKGFFIDSSSDNGKGNQSSDEEVYKIVEYETVADYKKNNMEKNLETGDHTSNDIKVIVNVKDRKIVESSAILRDVVIQGSNVNIPKRCDVIGVGIITQRDLREMRKPILKKQEDISDEESEQELYQVSKKCDFAESFLQDYYRRHWTPLGIDLLSWCVSDSHLQCCSENSQVSFNNQGDGSRSCPNIYDDFQASTIISSNEPCRPCHPCSPSITIEDDEKPDSSFSSKFFQKFKSKNKDEHDCCKRVLPKDSLEVFKKRQIYALSNKSKWARPSYGIQKPASIESTDIECNKNPMVEYPTPKNTCFKPTEAKTKKKPCKKHVSMPDCDTINESLAKQLSDKHDGILAFKGAAGCDVCTRSDNKCAKHAKVDPENYCEITPPPCINKCKKDPQPPCDSLSSAVSRESKTKQCLPKLRCQPSPTVCPPSPPSESTPPCSTSPKPPYLKPKLSKSSPKPSAKTSCSSCKVACPKLSSPKMETCKIPTCKIRSTKMETCKIPTCKIQSPKPSSPKTETCYVPPCKLLSSKPSSPKTQTCNIPACKVRSPKSPSPKRETCKVPPCKIRNPKSSPKYVETPPSRTPSPSPPSSPCKQTCPSKLDHRKRQGQSPPNTPCPQSATHSKKNSPEKRPSPLCAHFPPCKQSQSSQISPNFGSSQNTPCVSPPQSPKAKKNTTCNVPPCNMKKKQEKKKPSPPPVRCNTPPCRKPSPPASDDECKEFPWPMNNQVSNQPSLDSEACAPPPKKSKDPNKCIKNCPLSPKYSGQSLAPKAKKDKECKPDCANQPNQSTLSPPPLKASEDCAPLAKKSKDSNKCIKNCPFSGNDSRQSLAPKVKKDKNCKPDCANRPKQSTPPLKTCPPLPPVCPPLPPKPGSTKSKISGLFLKMKPSKKKTCAEECLAWNEQENLEGVIRLNSKEKISIRLKAQTPSTEEIREGMNIKVQDEDGQTLFERIDYTNQCGKHKPSVLGDMYKTSNINRISTPVIVKNLQTTQETDHVEATEIKSDGSIANLIEIQFKLRVTHGEKTTEIDIGNENGEHTKKNDLSPSPQEVYVVKDKEQHMSDEISSPKNDVNIKIVIKNYKHTSKRSKIDKCNDYYTKNISDKFHTVSTGYSDMCAEQNPENVFSVHRTTIDLTSSIETSRTQSLVKLSQETSKELLDQDPINLVTVSHSAEHSWRSLDKTEPEKVEEQLISNKKYNVQSRFDPQHLESDMNVERIEITDTDDAIDTNNVSSSQSVEVASKSMNKKEKKEILKKIFEKANRMKTNDKERMKQLRDMLKVILTSDSSCHEEMAVTSNELAKDVTYASLKPNYFRDTDSMNNYYKNDSNVSSGNESRRKKYPTEENNSVFSKSDEISSDNETGEGCMCSALAERLNLNNIGEGKCCCRNATKKTEETNCDMSYNDDYLLNVKTAELIDIETQNSMHLSSKVNSTNVSIHNRRKSSLVGYPSTVVAHVEGTSKIFAQKTTKTIKAKNKLSPLQNHIKECERKLSKNKILTVSDEDISLFDAKIAEFTTEYKRENKHVERRINNEKTKNIFPAADILQSYETKKAVLEIYAEKAFSNNDEHLVARLPKFIFEKKSEIRRNYNKITHYRNVCKKNIVMMSIQR